jgi:KRAB domain-containing zinc finger protein
MTKNSEEKVKKDPEGNFLFLPFESPKMPKSIKREVMRKEVKNNRGGSTNFSKHQCKICKKYFQRKSYLDQHTERHFQPSSFECKKCEKTFKMKRRFDAHKCVKKSERHFCEFCEKNYSTAHQIQTHQKKIHADQLNVDWLYCEFCNEKFFTKGNLKKHLENFQCRKPKQKIFTCDHCGKDFDERGKISPHVRVHAIYKVKCEICHTQVKLARFREHTRMMHERKITNFKCKICKKDMKNLISLRNHERNHNSKPFKCPLCDLKLKSKPIFLRHLKRVHEKNREKNFKCNQCDYKTDDKSSLKIHLDRHERLDKKLENFSAI